MAVTTIPWNDGSGDNIYLTYSSASGDQTVQVASDANTGSARSKVVTFTSGVGNIAKQLTINQEAGGPQSGTLAVNPSSYDTSDYSYESISRQERAYTDESSTTYCQINLTTGAQAETYVYFGFDVSSIPANATIDEVTCVAKGNVSNASSANIQTRNFQLFSGTTAMGQPSSALTTTGTQYTIDGGTWTRVQLSNIRIRCYAKRGNNNVSNAFNFRFHGATLTVEWHI